MINVIQEQWSAMLATVMEQQNRVANEANSAADLLNVGKVNASTTMETARRLRQEAAQKRQEATQKDLEADALLAEANRQMDSAITNSQAIMHGMVQQMADGQMVTGCDTPVLPNRKPKLVKAATGDET